MGRREGNGEPFTVSLLVGWGGVEVRVGEQIHKAMPLNQTFEKKSELKQTRIELTLHIIEVPDWTNWFTIYSISTGLI